jgi:AraC-like DNA-binding protein
MTRSIETKHLSDRQRPAGEWLEQFGVAVEYFPHYQTVGERHGHNFVEMNVILSGHGRQQIEERWYPMQRGCVSVIHYDQSHALICDTDELELLNVYLDPGVFPLPRLSKPLQHILPAIVPLHREFRHQQNRIILFQLRDPQPPITLLKLILRELEGHFAGSPRAIRHYVELFLIECCRQYRPGDEQVPPRSSGPSEMTAARMERVRRYLDVHFDRPVSLEELAEQGQCCESHLCRVFKQYTGRSTSDYLKHRRIERAMVLLRSTNEKILTVALQSGFGDLSHFNRTFKQIVGHSPRQYRQQWS